MKENRFKRPLIKNISEAARSVILAELQQYALTILGATVVRDRMSAQPIGSGTLVQIDGQLAILTAGHVIDALRKKYSHLGIAFRDKEESPKYDLGKLCIQGAWNKGEAPSASDWALIFLPLDSIGYLKANKKFLNLSDLEDASSRFSFEGRLAVLMGTPREWCKEDSQTRDDHQHWDLKGMCGMGGITGVRRLATTNVLLFDAVFDEFYGGPDDFGGVSGGSLWLIDVKEETAGRFEIVGKDLVGLPFWQDEIEAKRKITISCHEIAVILREYSLGRS